MAKRIADRDRYLNPMPAESPTTSFPRTAAVRCVGLALAGLITAAVGASSALAAPANYAGASTNGAVVFFTTTEQLVPGDTDSRRDVYERSFDAGVGDYVTREVSTGPIGGNDAFDALFEKASADGTKAFFSTDESLVATDTDHNADIYMRDLTNGTTTLVSLGDSLCVPACGNGPSDAGLAGASADGSEAFFVTDEQLSAGDTDNAVDVYERNLLTSTTTLVSAGGSPCPPGCGNGDFNAVLRGISPDGTRAFFATFEQLSNSDTDTALDLYARDLPNGPTTLVSQGDPSCAPCGNSNSSPAVFAGSSTNGSKVFFETDEGLVTGDTDGSNDLYQRTGGVTTLISGGTLPGFPANFMASSDDGAHVFFITAESLVGGDANSATDVYEWSGGAPSLITSGTCTQGAGAGCGSTFDAATADGTKILFTTTEQLDGVDTDTSPDVYEQNIVTGTPTLVSQSDAPCAPACGNGAAQAIFNGVSSDASKVFFTTTEQLVPQDVDPNADIYMRNLGTSSTALASPLGVCPISGCDAVFNGASSDGAHVFFQTTERLTAGDIDSEIDIYERSAGQTRLVSTGNSVVLGPATPVLTGTNPASPGASITPAILGQADLNTSIKLYTTPDCSGVPAAAGTSLDLGGAGISVTVTVGSTTSFRATATDGNGDTSPCSASVSYTQASAPPPPPPPDSGGGSGSGSGGSSTGTTPGGGHTFLMPQTLITFAPASKTRARRPTFRFTDATDQAGTTFLCKVDRAAWQPCNSPMRLKQLRWGKHTFQVVGTNAAGAEEPAAVKRSFKVVRG
jgi:Tol biopolymer transport system component